MSISCAISNITAVSCFVRGGSHSVYVNRAAGKATAVPRHREINDLLARKICRDLDVPQP